MNGSFKDLLIGARERAPSAITSFLQTTTDSDTIVAFVEGKDDEAFYCGYLVGVDGGDVHFVQCYSKAGVLRAREFFVKSKVRKPCKAAYFLCDSDFDIYLHRGRVDGVFYTRHYSVESYLLDQEFFEFVLRKHCGLTRKKARQEVSASLFRSLCDAAQRLRFLFAAMCCVRSVGSDIDFDECPLVQFLDNTSEGGEILLIQPPEVLRKLNLDEAHEQTVQEFSGVMEQHDFRCWLRGKHGWQLLKELIKRGSPSDVPASFKAYFSVVGLREYSSMRPVLPELTEYVTGVPEHQS